MIKNLPYFSLVKLDPPTNTEFKLHIVIQLSDDVAFSGIQEFVNPTDKIRQVQVNTVDEPGNLNSCPIHITHAYTADRTKEDHVFVTYYGSGGTEGTGGGGSYDKP